LQQLCDAVGTQAREAARTLEQLRSMLESRAVVADQETLRDLDRIRERAAGVAEGLHEMLNLMERMHMRLRTR